MPSKEVASISAAEGMSPKLEVVENFFLDYFNSAFTTLLNSCMPMASAGFVGLHGRYQFHIDGGLN